MISDKYKYIFLHVPKCAGVTINNMLKANGHISVPEIAPLDHNWDSDKFYFIDKPCHELNSRQTNNLFKWLSYYQFAFVRNPYARMVSGWKYTFPGIPLKYFIKGLKTCQDGHIIWHCRISQDTHIGNDIDFIGKVESFDKDIKKVFKKLGLKYKKIPKGNVTKHLDYRAYYSNETRKLVYNMFEKDFERFGYKESL